MSYTAKTDWKGNDPVTEGDINRWETGIEAAHEELENKIDDSELGVPGGVATLGTDGKVDPSQLEDATVAKKGRVQLSNATDSTSESLAATPKAVKTVADQVTKNTSQVGTLTDLTDDLKVIKSNKDSNGIFTTVTYRRKTDNTLFATSVLSGGTSPSYTTRTITYYEPNGTTVRKTVTNTLSYDADGALVSEV